MVKLRGNLKRTVKVYNGYGHTHDLVIYGHVFKKKTARRKYYSNNVLINTIHLLKLFFVTPVANVKLRLKWNDQLLYSESESDGFFKFEWKSDEAVSAGWHGVEVGIVSTDGKIICTGEGKVFVPHVTQYAFISDIDDTVLVSHSATIGKRLRVLFTKNPRTRRSFDEIVKHYELLARAHTTGDVLNPFFYVSSSEWNLYDDLTDFFAYNGLPQGGFLLNQVKRWFQLLKTGKTKHEGKLLRVIRILKTFPKQRFILFGDNTQSDPSIYASVVKKYHENIHAVYIRNIKPENEQVTREILSGIEKHNVYTCLFNNSNEAIMHSKTIGLI